MEIGYNKIMVPDAANDTDVVRVGRHVLVELVYETGEVEQLAFDVVPDRVADFASGLLGESTPLAQALLGKRPGEALAYRAGDVAAARLLAVSTSERDSYGDVAARRRAILQEAVDHSDRTNALIYAASVNNKWGDYDPVWLDESFAPQREEDVPPPDVDGAQRPA